MNLKWESNPFLVNISKSINLLTIIIDQPLTIVIDQPLTIVIDQGS